jgi:hypothetical protein
MAMQIIPVTDRCGAIIEPGWLAKAEAVHRELRLQIPADYVAKMRAVFADGGRMAVAAQGDRVVGLAVYRAYEDTFNGRKLYCDDLVTTEAERSTGVGHALMQFMEQEAIAYRCTAFALDSGVQRKEAHRFYFREGMYVISFNFKKDMSR